jgi:hypothetical protein
MHTQKRKLQRMHTREKEQESKRQRDEFFIKLQPMTPQLQWMAKVVSEALKDTRVEAVEEQEVADVEILIKTKVN